MSYIYIYYIQQSFIHTRKTKRYHGVYTQNTHCTHSKLGGGGGFRSLFIRVSRAGGGDATAVKEAAGCRLLRCVMGSRLRSVWRKHIDSPAPAAAADLVLL